MALFSNQGRQAQESDGSYLLFRGSADSAWYSAGMYALLTGVLLDNLPLGGGMAENWIHCGLISVVGTAVCCILFLLPDKRIVPYSFASLPVITIMCVVAAFQLEPAARNMMLYVTFLYTLMPILVGNAVSWTLYFKLYKKPMPRRL